MIRFASIAVRQALITGALVLVALALLAIATLVTVERSMRADLAHTIDTDMAGLADGMAQGGLPEVSRRIRDRTDLRTASGATPYYLLLDGAGRPIAGNLAHPPAVDPAASELAQKGGMLVRATRLRGGSLYVGRSLDAATRTLAALRWRLMWASAAIALAALVIGLALAERLRRRVARFNTAFRAFEQGDLQARVGEPSSDEFGLLASHIDRHLDQIARLLETQRDISNNIAHELRTPLTHVDMRLRRLLEHPVDSATALELEAAREDVRSIVSLFDALLDIALAAAASRHTGGSFDLSELAGDIADLYDASAEEAGLELTTRIAPGILMQGEPMQITRLLSNLLDNAIKFVPAGCRVRLIVDHGPRLIVEDNGPGVLPEHRELVFARFARAGATEAGHGLGLALVKVIAARHGLRVRCEDADPGARFVIEREG